MELGRGPRDAVGVGRFRDLLGHSRSGGETAKAEGHVACESVVDTARDARGKLRMAGYTGILYENDGWEKCVGSNAAVFINVVSDFLRFFLFTRRVMSCCRCRCHFDDTHSRHGRCAGWSLMSELRTQDEKAGTS